MKILSLKLPASLDAELEAAAARRGTTKSAILREALESHLAREADAQPTGKSAGPISDEIRESAPPYETEEGGDARSFLSLAEDLAGCVEGPADLSSNPEHLRDFGR
jgi:hypothetical protein